MMQFTGPAVAVIAVIGYLGIDAIVRFVGNLFNGKEKQDEDKQK